MTNPIFITINQDKPAYHKMVTPDRVINLTGESGSGKSSLCQKEFFDNKRYLIIDTDEIFSSNPPTSSEMTALRAVFEEQSKDILIKDFDTFYKRLLSYFANDKRILVIDSAQYRNMKDVSLLRGDVVVMRTCVDKCYQRCLDRYILQHPTATTVEKEKYAQKKKGMYTWYHSLNAFIERVDNL